MLRIPFYCVAYMLGLKLRKKAAQLPSRELSNFLCNTVLLGGISAVAPIIFFAFEVMSCFASFNFNFSQGGNCDNTLWAALWLSIYLVIMTGASIASKTVSWELRGEGLTYKSLAILRLKWRQKFQGALGVIVALASMYLFSVLGVQGKPNDVDIPFIGIAGGAAIFIAALIEMFTIAFGESVGGKEQTVASLVQGPRRISSGEGSLSLDRAGDDMIISDIV